MGSHFAKEPHMPAPPITSGIKIQIIALALGYFLMAFAMGMAFADWLTGGHPNPLMFGSGLIALPLGCWGLARKILARIDH
jgi:hypothetical protein